MERVLQHNAETGSFLDPSTGEEFIKCDAQSARPVWLNVTGQRWETRVIGRLCLLDWDKAAAVLPPLFLSQAKEAIRKILKRRDAKYLNMIRRTLNLLGELLPSSVHDWPDLTLHDINGLLTHDLPKSFLTILRALYRQVALDLGSEVMAQRLVQLDAYRQKNRRKSLRGVITWDHDFGAFVAEECETLMQFLKQVRDESAADHAIRLIALIGLHLGKRSSQIISIPSDGLVTLQQDGTERNFLRVPRVKVQRGRPSKLWVIPQSLADDIRRFSGRPVIHGLQQRHHRLFVWESRVLDQGREIPTYMVSSRMAVYFRQAQLKTQRDRSLPPRPLVFTLQRARHTVGTRLAFAGASAAHISWVLEHDSPASAQSYVDAVQSYVQEAIDGADRQLGRIFTTLAHTYFNGQVSDVLTDRSVIIPDPVIQPLPVGSCASGSTCRKHPFFSCYNGCPSFLAWRSADHSKALLYVEQEMKRWTEREDHPERSAILLEFERLYQAILDVIRRIEEGNGGPGK